MKHLLLLLALLITGCASHLNPSVDYLPAYQQGNFGVCENKLNQALADKKSKDTVWLLLDRATVHFAQGKTDEAIRDYQLAIEAIDYYSQMSVPEKAAQLLLTDSVEAYAGEDFEQVLARVYFALALIQKGDTNNAFALLRQAETVQQQKREEYKQTRYTAHYNLVDNSLAKYLLALLSEKQGDYSNAEILYRQAGYALSEDRNAATVLVIGHNGNAPYKVSGRCPVSQVSMIALDIFLASQSKQLQPALSSLTGIPIPVLCQTPASEPRPLYAAIGSEKKQLQPIYNVTEVAYEQLHQKLPVIAARGAARMLLRRAAVGCVQEQDPTAGAIVDIAMLVANLNTTADTRSWTTLPARIDMARFDLPPGNYTLTLASSTLSLDLKPRGLCIINLFH